MTLIVNRDLKTLIVSIKFLERLFKKWSYTILTIQHKYAVLLMNYFRY